MNKEDIENKLDGITLMMEKEGDWSKDGVDGYGFYLGPRDEDGALSCSDHIYDILEDISDDMGLNHRYVVDERFDISIGDSENYHTIHTKSLERAEEIYNNFKSSLNL